MKIALLGATGMLGSKMMERFKARNHEILAPPRSELDVTSPLSVEKFFKENDFQVLLNCSGFTQVDACEETSQYPQALSVNAMAVGWLARFCMKSGRFLVHYSTDYVFNGTKDEPYVEIDTPSPLSAYGRTKWMGEKMVLEQKSPFYLIRTSWLYGPGEKNFMSTIAELLKTRTQIEVVTDQVGAPTYTGDLAEFTLELFEKKANPGIYHFSNKGVISWHGVALEIQKQLNLNGCEITPITGEQYGKKYNVPAKRPANSRFDLAKAEKAIQHPIRPWTEALRDYLTKELTLETA